MPNNDKRSVNWTTWGSLLLSKVQKHTQINGLKCFLSSTVKNHKGIHWFGMFYEYTIHSNHHISFVLLNFWWQNIPNHYASLCFPFFNDKKHPTTIIFLCVSWLLITRNTPIHYISLCVLIWLWFCRTCDGGRSYERWLLENL